jgi:GntR family transcriptional repressor for pyruvate dehydrogenase complex
MKAVNNTENPTVSLVDQVEDKLLTFIKHNNIQVGDAMPNEMELTATLGVARNVLREALSRLRMMGLIDSRTRRGMVLTEPSLLGGMRRVIDPRIMSDKAIMDILGLRVSLEIGMCAELFRRLNDKHIEILEGIVKSYQLLGVNEYSPTCENAFHSTLYEITGNATIAEFQSIIYPVMLFVKDKHNSLIESINQRLKVEGKLVTHADLLELLKQRNKEDFQKALEQHFLVYSLVMESINN